MYLLYGMTYEQYWFASPFLVKYYRELHALEVEKRNEELWLQGLYNLKALQSVMSSIFGKKGSEGVPYPDKPLDIFPKPESQIKAEREQEKKKAIDNLNAWKRAMENKYGRNNNKS